MITELDTHNPEEIAEFERAFHNVFAPLTHNQLIRRLWDWDNEGLRLRVRVPYAEQTIFVRRDQSGNIETALAMGLQLKTTQSEFYEFEIPQQDGHCEALAFFGRGERHMRETMRFWNACRDTLRQRGFTAIYGTCAPRVMPVYQWVGGQILQTREFDAETRYFFRIALKDRPTAPYREGRKPCPKLSKNGLIEGQERCDITSNGLS